LFDQVSRSGGPTKIELDAMEREKKTSFATLGRNSSGINITFSGGEKLVFCIHQIRGIKSKGI
jgi:hypothetical protein